MKTAEKNHSSSEKKKEDKHERTSTGKKLIQARLPFKILSTASSTEHTTSKSPKNETGSTSKKRKLNFDESSNNSLDTKVSRKFVTKSDVKENLSTTKEAASSDIVEVVISDEEEKNSSTVNDKKTDKSTSNSQIITSENESKTKIDAQSGNKSPAAPKNSEKPKSNKLKIKFPFTDKKKRTRKNDSTKSDDDGSKSTEETLSNPSKKLRKDEINDSLKRNGTLISSSVVELISDDDEPIEDSDNSASEDMKSLNDDNIQNQSNNFELKGKTTEREVNGGNEDGQRDECSKIISNEGDDNKTKNSSILIEDDDMERSNHSEKVLSAFEISSNVKIKSSSVRISKNEFKAGLKSMKNSKTSEEFEESKANKEKVNGKAQEADSKSTEEGNEVQSISSSSDDDEIEQDSKTSGSQSPFQDNKKSLPLETNSDINEKTASASKTKSSSKLGPRRLKKLKEMEKRREERLKAKEEKEKKLQEEKDQKRKEREEKELQRKKEKEEKEEQKRKEKEEKDEQRRKEKEEKEKKRLAEIEAKNEERRQKEEEKKRKEQQKEDEKRRKEEERRKRELEKEEAENKKKRESEAFTKFFVQKQTSQQHKDNDEECLSNDAENRPANSFKFMPFQVKGHMKLAPLFRKTLNTEAKLILDKVLSGEEQESTSVEKLYLSVLKSGKYTPGRDTKTYSKDDEGSEIIVLEDELEGAGQTIDDTTKPQKYKAKFLYFHENQRPPYYGTWRKKSKTIKPRRPFATDKVYFDYEVDSDEEWEEEEPGESLSGSDDEKDKESEDDYEVDNEFFVPHGHLSEEEMQNQDEEEDNSPETQKAKLKLLQQEFAQEMNKKTEKIKPRLIGIVWQDENGNKPELCPDIIWSSLNKRAMIFTTPPVVVEPEKSQDTENNSSTIQEQNKLKQKEKIKLPEELIKDLIRLFHGNTYKKEFLIKEFQAYIKKKRETNSNTLESESEKLPNVEYSKAMIRKKIEKMAEWTIMQKNENKKKLCWLVNAEYLKKYDLEDLTTSNKWTYILEPKRRLADKTENGMNTKQKTVETETTVSNKTKEEKKSLPVITKFTKILSKEEKERQIKKTIIVNPTVTSGIIDSKSDVEIVEKKIEESKQNTEKMNDDSTLKSSNDKSSKSIVKKRVPLLMSVPRGQQFLQSSKDKLISDFLKKGQQSQQEKHENNDDKNTDVLKTDTNALGKHVPMEVDNDPVVVVID